MLALLEAAAEAGVTSFVFTSSTSTFGATLTPHENEPAAWITEDVTPVPSAGIRHESFVASFQNTNHSTRREDGACFPNSIACT
jgi:nucleoside-diphosphate-sugar epimerase